MKRGYGYRITHTVDNEIRLGIIFALAASPIQRKLNMQTLYDRNAQLPINPPNPFPAAIPTGTTWKSGVMPLAIFNRYLGALQGYNAITAALIASQAVTIAIQRYLDPAGAVPVGPSNSVVTVAASSGYVDLITQIPAMYFDVQVANASGTTAIITPGSMGIILGANP